MANFVYDNVLLPLKKEIDPVPDGMGAAFWGADDFNSVVRPALDDLRAAIIAGELIGFAPQAAAPVVPQASVYLLYVRNSDKHLIFSLNGAETDLLAGGGGGGGALITPVNTEADLPAVGGATLNKLYAVKSEKSIVCTFDNVDWTWLTG